MDDVRAAGRASATRIVADTPRGACLISFADKLDSNSRYRGQDERRRILPAFASGQACSRMIFIRWPLSEPSIPIAAFNSPSGITWLTSGSSRTVPRCTSAIEFG